MNQEKKFISGLENLTNLKNSSTPSSDYKIIEVENIPLCNKCLFEIQEGNFICETCKINLCENHLKAHLINSPEHKIIKLYKKI
jgi:hypothetical protein